MAALTNRILNLATQIQQIPAPTFHEEQRALFIRDHFLREKLAEVEIDSTGNVLGRLPGSSSAPPLVITAHTDTVFPLDTNLELTEKTGVIYGPGIGDNSLGLAGLLGLIWYLRQQKISLPGDLWLVANTCEEGLGDLRGMQAVVDRFDTLPLAYIVIEGMALGQIYHRGLGVVRYRITVRGAGGHSWVDHGTPSAIHALAELVTQITAIDIPEQPRTSLNIGVISGGTSVNTIASEASLELDLRSTEPKVLKDLTQEVERLVTRSNQPNLSFNADVIGHRPVGEIPKSHPLVKTAANILKGIGVQPSLSIGSTDANIPLSRGLTCICIGLTNGGGAHTVNEYINTTPLESGMTQLVKLVVEVFDMLK
jgi:acetylornithine deacetylase/succinyl-diaminopimelate desuccinylase-like protein